MELTQTRQLVLLGFLLIGGGIVGLYDAIVIAPTYTQILSNVRVDDPHISRVIPSVLVGLVGVAVPFGIVRSR